jgi:membrane protease YdiL (CAAX protease family)
MGNGTFFVGIVIKAGFLLPVSSAIQRFSEQTGSVCSTIASFPDGARNQIMDQYSRTINDTRLEVLVFLFLVIPSMLLSFIFVHPGSFNFSAMAISTILRDLGLLFLILFFLHRNREPFKSVGLTFKNGGDESLVGAMLFFPVYFFVLVIQQILQKLNFWIPERAFSFLNGPKDFAQLILGLILMMTVAVTEETIFRGYLIKRFQEFTGSKIGALFFSTAIFALGHTYQGFAGVCIVSVLGLIYGLIYFWRGNLIAPITMHFLQNSLGLLINR